MQDPQSGTTAKPSEVSHTIVIDTYGANGNPMAAQELLNDMYASADKEAEGDGPDSYSGRRARHVLPNSITYRSLMNSWGTCMELKRTSVCLVCVNDILCALCRSIFIYPLETKCCTI